jgi:hypothetical protein
MKPFPLFEFTVIKKLSVFALQGFGDFNVPISDTYHKAPKSTSEDEPPLLCEQKDTIKIHSQPYQARPLLSQFHAPCPFSLPPIPLRLISPDDLANHPDVNKPPDADCLPLGSRQAFKRNVHPFSLSAFFTAHLDCCCWHVTG